MTHRRDLVWLNIRDDLVTVKNKTGGEVHSVYPVAGKDPEKLLGVIYIKELFPKDFNTITFSLRKFLRKPLFVHENSPAYAILEQFKSTKIHHAIVVDEYGSIEGMVTMDDLLDALVGDLTEYNQEEYQIIKRDDQTWLADGQFSYYELLNYLKIEDDTRGNFTTLGGLILHLLHHIPNAGEKVEWNDFELEVVDMDDHRIDKVSIKRIK